MSINQNALACVPNELASRKIFGPDDWSKDLKIQKRQPEIFDIICHYGEVIDPVAISQLTEHRLPLPDQNSPETYHWKTSDVHRSVHSGQLALYTIHSTKGDASASCWYQQATHFGVNRALTELLISVNALYFAERRPQDLSSQQDISRTSMPLDLMPSTGDARATTPAIEIQAMEARQQRDAILIGRDLRSAVEALLSDESFTVYDLCTATGISRANLHIWRTRRVEKLRADSEWRLARLLFAWKLWLRVSAGDPLGIWLREPLANYGNRCLLDLLTEQAVAEREIESFLIELSRHVDRAQSRRLARRRDLAGLPGSASTIGTF